MTAEAVVRWGIQACSDMPAAKRPKRIYLAAPGVQTKVNDSVRSVVRFGAYEFDPYTGELRREGIRVRLEVSRLRIRKKLLLRPV